MDNMQTDRILKSVEGLTKAIKAIVRELVTIKQRQDAQSNLLGSLANKVSEMEKIK